MRSAPRRLLLVVTGNITNDELLGLFEPNLATIIRALEDSAFVEVGPTTVTTHRDAGIQ